MKKVVKFTKSACPHCRIFDPLFTERKDQFQGQVEFYEVSLDDAPHLAEVFKVRGVPALYTFESEDFKDFANIEQLKIGHSHEGYSEMVGSLTKLLS